MPRKQHTHKYQRMQFKYSGKVWACRLPDCNHFMPRDLEDTMEGKYSLCWSCGEQFMLTEKAMEDEQPKCDECRKKTGMEILERIKRTPKLPEDMPIEERLRKAGLL